MSQPCQPGVLGLEVPRELGSSPACATAAPRAVGIVPMGHRGWQEGKFSPWIHGHDLGHVNRNASTPAVPQFPSPALPWACTSLVPPAPLWTQLATPALPRAQPCASLPGAGLAPAPEVLEGSQVTSDPEGDTFCDTLEQMEPEKVMEEALKALPSLPCLCYTTPPAWEPHKTYRDTLLHLSGLCVTPGGWSLSQRGH